MKTQIVFEFDDNQYNEWKKGDKGYIDGYLFTDRPFIAVINLRTLRPVLVSFGGTIKVID